MKNTSSKVIFIIILLLCLLGVLNSPLALLTGFIFTILFGNPFLKQSQIGIQYLLKIAVVGLGFGMSLIETLETSLEGLSLTTLSIFLTVALGLLVGKYMQLDKRLSHLITSGTTICGGSAIAAVSPIIKAEPKTISIALGIVFFLNSVALFIFPGLGHFFNLSQSDFGLWCAVAIHDTSSVVGAALQYGEEALLIATTVKLSRTLWIIPLSIFSMLLFKNKTDKIKIPWFILGFIVAILINSYDLIPNNWSTNIVFVSKRLLILTLFLVGTTLSIKQLKETGLKPFLFAVVLWLFISSLSLLYILKF
ncbi:MAG: YeiH family protein [Xanthomarina gelatinilytica]|uniref:YeiH family protein n=1 Tax=Xanthomarina gelatinilytica TaxID=1137281 RepID=UPI003A8AF02A